MGKTVLTFGEIMMRLSPKDHLRIEQATEFDVRYGGAEANTALSLAYQGDKAAYVSVVPANRLGECALRSLKAYGVDTTRVVRQGDRLGSYVFEVTRSAATAASTTASIPPSTWPSATSLIGTKSSRASMSSTSLA